MLYSFLVSVGSLVACISRDEHKECSLLGCIYFQGILDSDECGSSRVAHLTGCSATLVGNCVHFLSIIKNLSSVSWVVSYRIVVKKNHKPSPIL